MTAPGRMSRVRARTRLSASLAVAAGAGIVAALLLTTVAVAESPAASGDASGAVSSPAPVESAAAASGGPAGSGGPAASVGPNTIQIIQKTFKPQTLTVHVGDTVTWTVTQAISDPHSVTSGSPTDPKPGSLFDSGIKLKNNGDTFTQTFSAAGTYPFFCQVHPDTMTGTITVLDANGSAVSEGPIPTSSKVTAAAILIVAIAIYFGWARIYRRMNPGP
jgi:plastocyanin